MKELNRRSSMSTWSNRSVTAALSRSVRAMLTGGSEWGEVEGLPIHPLLLRFHDPEHEKDYWNFDIEENWHFRRIVAVGVLCLWCLFVVTDLGTHFMEYTISMRIFGAVYASIFVGLLWFGTGRVGAFMKRYSPEGMAIAGSVLVHLSYISSSLQNCTATYCDPNIQVTQIAAAFLFSASARITWRYVIVHTISLYLFNFFVVKFITPGVTWTDAIVENYVPLALALCSGIVSNYSMERDTRGNWVLISTIYKRPAEAVVACPFHPRASQEQEPATPRPAPSSVLNRLPSFFLSTFLAAYRWIRRKLRPPGQSVDVLVQLKQHYVLNPLTSRFTDIKHEEEFRLWHFQKHNFLIRSITSFLGLVWILLILYDIYIVKPNVEQLAVIIVIRVSITMGLAIIVALSFLPGFHNYLQFIFILVTVTGAAANSYFQYIFPQEFNFYLVSTGRILLYGASALRMRFSSNAVLNIIVAAILIGLFASLAIALDILLLFGATAYCSYYLTHTSQKLFMLKHVKAVGKNGLEELNPRSLHQQEGVEIGLEEVGAVKEPATFSVSSSEAKTSPGDVSPSPPATLQSQTSPPLSHSLSLPLSSASSSSSLPGTALFSGEKENGNLLDV